MKRLKILWHWFWFSYHDQLRKDALDTEVRTKHYNRMLHHEKKLLEIY